MPVYPDELNPSKVKKVLFVGGQFYWDILARRTDLKREVSPFLFRTLLSLESNNWLPSLTRPSRQQYLSTAPTSNTSSPRKSMRTSESSTMSILDSISFSSRKSDITVAMLQLLPLLDPTSFTKKSRKRSSRPSSDRCLLNVMLTVFITIKQIIEPNAINYQKRFLRLSE